MPNQRICGYWFAISRQMVHETAKYSISSRLRMYLDGMGSVRIMKALIEENIPAPEGGLWNASVIMMMLKNEKYAGDLLLQKFFTNNHIEKKQCFNRGELPQYFVAEIGRAHV